MIDLEARKQLAELREMFESVKHFSNFEAVPPLHWDPIAGWGATLSLDTDFGDDFCSAVTDACSGLTRYLRQERGKIWLSDVACAQCGGSGSGSGSGSPITSCCELCYQTSFPGLANGFCTDSAIWHSSHEMYASEDNLCEAWLSNYIEACVNTQLRFFNDAGIAYLVFFTGNGVLARYVTNSSSWDCISPLTLTYAGSEVEGVYTNWPATITIRLCSGEATPTVDINTTDLCDDATTLTITGTNFTSPANTNTVTLSSGTFTVTSGSSTSLTGTLGGMLSLGAITAVVTNANGTSGTPVQVATVVFCCKTTSTPIGSGKGSSTLTVSLTVQTGLLVVNLAQYAPLGADFVNTVATFNGTPMTLQGDRAFLAVGYLYQFSLAVIVGTYDLVITTTNPSTLDWQAINDTGLTNNTRDLSRGANGGASTPNTGTTGTSSTACEIAHAVFALQVPIGSPTWGGTPVFISDGQDVSDSFGASAIILTGGTNVASVIETFDASLSGVTVTSWAGLLITYS